MTNYKKLSELGRPLKEGDEIKLGGRSGKITEISRNRPTEKVKWMDIDHVQWIDADAFPELLVKVPQPTISREARDAILAEMGKWYNSDVNKSLKRLLDSMVEDE